MVAERWVNKYIPSDNADMSNEKGRVNVIKNTLKIIPKYRLNPTSPKAYGI
jgi:hypothetical protein